MSGVVKGLKKVFRKLKESKILKAIVVAAIVWFTVGTASAYFAAPQAGLGSAMSTTATNMWSTTTQFFGAEATAAPGATPVGQSQAMVPGSSAGSGVADAVFEPLDYTMNAAAKGASSVDLSVGTNVGANSASAFIPPPPPPTGPMAWMNANPAATMMLGQGISGAIGSREERKAEDARIAERRERGLMGFDYAGQYRGLVGSQIAPVEQPVVNAAQAPIVAGQTITPPTTKPVMLPRDQLPLLNEQGQIVRG